mgnify:CR=1 FL=1
MAITRRAFLKAGCLCIGTHLLGCGGGARAPRTALPDVGVLGAPDANGVRLPPGFESRIVARTGETPVAGGAYAWHGAPDGGAVFPAPGGGWIYVSNAECRTPDGGVGALRFDRDGTVVDAYPILAGTDRNCAGGATPWDTWLSCEEASDGRVWECDPFGVDDPVVLPALGVFCHEAAAVDPVRGHVYLTEDERDGRFYRFVPDVYPDLSSGRLEVAEVAGGGVVWHPVPDPSAATGPTRYQVAASTPFNGGEGCDLNDGRVYFTTKGDDRVWCYDIAAAALTVLYPGDSFLTGVDNVLVTPDDEVLVAEDGGDLEIVAILPGGELLPLLQLVGHDDSEIAGPAFDPSRRRLYFSSQRGTAGDGITFEIAGPFVA